MLIKTKKNGYPKWKSYFLSSLSGDLQGGRTEQNKTTKKKTKKINKQTKNQNKEKYLKARFPGTFSKSKGKKRPNKG